MNLFHNGMIMLAICLLAFGCAGNFADKAIIADESKLFDTDVAFSLASEANGAAEAFNMYLADTAIQLPAGSHPIIGRDAIYQEMKDSGDVILTWTPVKAEISRSGDLGYTWGNYKVSARGSDGEAKIGYGKYLNVWAKQSNGEWKVLIDMGNSSPPPEDTPPE
jgi:ketosteroid isomerase-like protein